MSDLIRDAPLGQIIRWVTGNKYLQYPEEKQDFKCPNSYLHKEGQKTLASTDSTTVSAHQQDPEKPAEEAEEAEQSYPNVDTVLDATTPFSEPDSIDLAKAKTEADHEFAPIKSKPSTLERVGSRVALQRSRTQAELQEAFTLSGLEKGPTQPIAPQKLEDGTILVDWYDTDDPANPQNWSLRKKNFVAFQICLYTFAVYMGSAIYASSEPGVQARFGVSPTASALGLSLYVLAYGIGPMIFSPLSEIPLIGRNPPYMVTFAIFVILLLPAALVDNFAGLLVLRFLQGFFGSPCLATGGASLQDMFSLIKLPYILSIWAAAATCGPALAPVISGFSVQAENWRWSLWEMLWLAGPVWIVLFLFLPETSSSNILLRRAQRLRKITGDKTLKSQSEIDQKNLKFSAVAAESLVVPIKLMFLDPAIAFTAFYTALIYGIYYSFFEAFPQVYIEMYHFNLGTMGLTFLSIIVGAFIAIAGYWAYVYWVVEPEIRAHGLGAPERRLIPALFISFLLPIGLFMFGWTSRPSVHWIVSIIGVAIFTIGIFLIIQCIFVYLPLVYPQYAASLFAGNDLARSTLAAGAVLFSRPMFHNLGIGPGVSLLAGCTCACIFGVFGLYFYGDKLRARSRFAAK